MASRRTVYPVFLPWQNMVHAGSSSGSAWAPRLPERAAVGVGSCRAALGLQDDAPAGRVPELAEQRAFGA